MRRTIPLLAAVCALPFSGCIRKTLSLSSEPSGAQVVINGQPAGVTPTKVRFLHHGTYRVELTKPGYQPVIDRLRLWPKPYELMPADFVFDVVVPVTIHDERAKHYELRPIEPLDVEKAVASARRAAAEAEKVIPRLYEAPPPNPHAKDRAILPRSGEPETKEPRGEGEPPKQQPAKKPKPAPGETEELPAPEDVPEIEAGRGK